MHIFFIFALALVTPVSCAPTYSQRVVATFNTSFGNCHALGYRVSCSDPPISAFTLACVSSNASGAAVIRFIEPSSGAVSGNDDAAIAVNGASLSVLSITGNVQVPAFPSNDYITYVVSGQNALWAYAISILFKPKPTQFQLLCGVPSLVEGKPSDGTCDVATFGKLVSFAPNVGDFSKPSLGSNIYFKCNFYVADGFSVRCVSFSYNTTGQVTTLVAYEIESTTVPLAFLAVGGSYKLDCSSIGTRNFALNRPSLYFWLSICNFACFFWVWKLVWYWGLCYCTRVSSQERFYTWHCHRSRRKCIFFVVPFYR